MLVDTLLDAATRSPEHLAVEDGAASLTYGQLTNEAAILCDALDHLTQGPTVGIMLPASAMFPPALFGVLWSSRIAVPLNFMLAPDELVGVVRDAGLDAILTVRHFEALVEKLPARAVFLDELLRSRTGDGGVSSPVRAAPKVSPSDTAVILYTSGTTSAPKGVELTHRNLHSNAVDSITAIGLDSSDRFLNVLPPFHVFGLTAGVLIPVSLGISAHAVARFSPTMVRRTVRDKRVTLMMAVPSMYAALLRSKSARRDDFASVTMAISGGEPLPDAVRTGFQERFGVTLCQGYGLTETSPVVAVSSRSDHRPGTVGRAIPNVEIRIVDSQGCDRKIMENGEILVRGPGVMKGYHHRPEQTRTVLDDQGWFHTGDIGMLDGDGFLSITGRAKEMLIVGGENVFTREIEAVLESHEQIVQAAVIGMPDDLRGEVPIAFVIPVEGGSVTESDVRSFARQSLAGFKVPRKIVIRSELPIGPTGKILKRRLNELL